MNRRTFLKSVGSGGLSRFVPASLISGTAFAQQTAPSRLVKQFSTPAKIQDLSGAGQSRFDDLWHWHLKAFTQQAICGDPWSKAGMSHEFYYYDPTSTLIAGAVQLAMISWIAFPNRLNQYFGTATALPFNPYMLPQNNVWELADNGFYSDEAGRRRTFPEVPINTCPQADWKGPLQHFGPYGPRGWQDEYCEWSVTRNAQGKIARVDFVCENPEYWHVLWRVNPDRVAQLYQDILNFGLPSGSADAVRVAKADLELLDPANGEPVIDPSTGSPAYNPQNKWNRGTLSIRGGANATGGAIHLTSSPNTLQTELANAAAVATILRDVGNQDAQRLGCCSRNTQPYRNSDFHIGQIVNQIVGSGDGHRVTVADPVGLYIQEPDFSVYALPDDPKLPKGATVADCWHIVRGTETLNDPISGQQFPGNFILHAAFQIPQAWIDAGVSFTVGDITIRHNGVATPIRYGAQIAETFEIGLFAWSIRANARQIPQACVADLKPPRAEPIQLLYRELWDAYFATPIDDASPIPTNLTANSLVLPVEVSQGAPPVSTWFSSAARSRRVPTASCRR
jgi:hypothetical protein